MRGALPLFFLCAMGMVGCRTTAGTTAQFPSAWPARTPLPSVHAPAAAGRGTGIAIAVVPWTWPGAMESGGSPTTTEVLTQLTEAALRAQGFEVVDDSAAAYRLGCSVQELSYAVHGGYPSERQYTARASCQLVRTSDQQLLWQRELTERVDETLYVNTYTRLPAHHERAFARECLPALMDRLTESLLIFFRDELPLRALPAAPSDATAPAGPEAPFQK